MIPVNPSQGTTAGAELHREQHSTVAFLCSVQKISVLGTVWSHVFSMGTVIDKWHCDRQVTGSNPGVPTGGLLVSMREAQG